MSSPALPEPGASVPTPRASRPDSPTTLDRYDPGSHRWINGEFQYFVGKRWSPVRFRECHRCGTDSRCHRHGRRTRTHQYEPHTLAKKRRITNDTWRNGDRSVRITHKLEWDESLKEYVREVSDNDGGYSGNYLAAQSYRYAVAKDPEARREATNTFHALCWLESMTGIPGWRARSGRRASADTNPATGPEATRRNGMTPPMDASNGRGHLQRRTVLPFLRHQSLSGLRRRARGADEGDRTPAAHCQSPRGPPMAAGGCGRKGDALGTVGSGYFEPTRDATTGDFGRWNCSPSSAPPKP